MPKNFADKLVEAIQEKNSSVCVGIDPYLDRVPGHIIEKAQGKQGPTLIAAAEAILNFNKGIIDAVHDLVPVVKVQAAFFEQYGFHGMWAFDETCKYAKSKGLLVIADVKRGDIGTTAKAYSAAYLGQVDVFGKKSFIHEIDAVTVNAYLGYDGIQPFLDDCGEFGKGIFVLVKTSNDSSSDLQDRVVDESGLKIYEMMGHFVESWGSQELGESGYSYVGAVVGATHPSALKELREIMPHSFFLVPGYGAQGASAEDVKAAFNDDGLGALVSSSRGILYAYENSDLGPEKYDEAARKVVEEMNELIGS